MISSTGYSSSTFDRLRDRHATFGTLRGVEMNRFPTIWLLALCIITVESPVRAAPPRAVELGETNQAFAVWFDTGSSVAWLAGADSPGSGREPRVWSVDASDVTTTYFPESLLPAGAGAVSAISDNGLFYCGESKSVTTDPHEGTLWRAGEWGSPEGTGVVPGGGNVSSSRGVANSGTTAGSSSGLYGFRKTIDGAIEQLPGLPGGTGFGVAEDVSSDGSVIVGSTQNTSFANVAVRWVEGGSEAEPLEDPLSLFADALAVSPDGSIIGGTVTTSTTTAPCLWIDGVLQVLVDSLGHELIGQVNEVTDDGFAVGTALFGADQKGFVYHRNWANAITLEDWLEDAGFADPPLLTEARDVCFDGASYHIAGAGLTFSYYIVTDAVEGTSHVISEYEVEGFRPRISVWPNPVRHEAVVSFTLDRPRHIQLFLSDARGRRVETLMDDWLTTGFHQTTFGKPESSGLFFIGWVSGTEHGGTRVTVLR